MRTLVWFRQNDLRLTDHAPLWDAAAQGEVVPVFVMPERPRQFLLEALANLDAGLRERGSGLVMVKSLRGLRADRVVAHRVGRECLTGVTLFEGATLHPPGTLRSQSGKPFTQFTPFARAWERASVIGRPLPAPRRLPPLPKDVRFEPVPLPAARGGARRRLAAFARRAEQYGGLRNRLDLDATSRLSADLSHGTLSVREVWAKLHPHRAFANELLWREFAHSTLYDFPHVLSEPLRPQWRGFPWRRDEADLRAWAEGRTGYPVVDAAARQLLGEGFVHNRARMIAASFLTRHLLIDFRLGEAHYAKWLSDFDVANNDAGWQWSAGCGTDGQPWFRIFNPVLQGQRFDPTGAYVRQWVPELRGVPDRFLHAPWLAPAPPRDYPPPMVDQAAARARFLGVARTFFKASPRSRAPR